MKAFALAASPALVGYSLVGVYPCAVWKPRRADTSNVGPVRSRVTGAVRTQPYHRQEVSSSTTATAGLQTPQVLVTACSCRGGGSGGGTSSEAVLPQPTVGPQAPMLFVPFTVPNFAPPMTGATLHTNNCSPSKVTTVV